MVNEDLLKYIKEELAKGTSQDVIKTNLLSQGWNTEDMKEGFFAVESKTSPQSFINTQEKSKHSFAAIIILIICLIGGGVFAYYKYISNNKSIKIEQKDVIETNNSENLNIIPSTTTTQSVSTTSNSGIIECGSDMTCFINASKNCSLASVKSSINLDFFGVITKSKGTYELKGLDSNKECIFYNRADDISIVFSQNIIDQAKAGGASNTQIQEQIKIANDQAKENIGKILKCTSNNLSEILTNWNNGEFNSDDFPEGNCNYIK